MTRARLELEAGNALDTNCPLESMMDKSNSRSNLCGRMSFFYHKSQVLSQQNLILHWKMVKQKAFGEPG